MRNWFVHKKGSATEAISIFQGTNDPYAFVEFVDHAQAAQALQTMNRRMLLDKVYYILMEACFFRK